MKTITIQQVKGKFVVRRHETEDSREDFESDPHPYGFYHYPDNIKDLTAFNRLKKSMIKDREERIEIMKAEIKELKGMKYEN